MSINSSGAAERMKGIANGKGATVTKRGNPSSANQAVGKGPGQGMAKPGVPAQGETHFSGPGGSGLGKH